MLRFLKAVSVTLAIAIAALVAQPTPAHAAQTHSIWIEHGTGGLNGNLTVRTVSGTPFSMAPGSAFWKSKSDQSMVNAVYAGSGYCVWEQYFEANSLSASDGNYTWKKDIRYGKDDYGRGLSSRWFSTYSYGFKPADLRGQKSVFRIYSC